MLTYQGLYDLQERSDSVTSQRMGWRRLNISHFSREGPLTTATWFMVTRKEKVLFSATGYAEKSVDLISMEKSTQETKKIDRPDFTDKKLCLCLLYVTFFSLEHILLPFYRWPRLRSNKFAKIQGSRFIIKLFAWLSYFICICTFILICINELYSEHFILASAS